MHSSLRNRLLVILLGTGLLTWVMAATIIYIDSRREIGELLDAELAQIAKVLLTLSNHELHEAMLFSNDKAIPLETIDTLTHRYEKKLVYQVWFDNSQLALVSNNSPLTALAAVEHGYSMTNLNQQQWRVFSLSDELAGITVHVGELQGGRQALASQIAERALLLILIALGIVAGLTWLGVGRALQPLNKIANQVSARHSFDLTEIHSLNTPREAQPLVDSINNLLRRLAAAFYHERSFTANAAHELRTPLAGIGVHNDIALLAISQTTQKSALLQVKQGIRLMSRMVQQLLTLARLDQDAIGAAFTPVCLGALTQSVIDEHTDFAHNKGICIKLDHQAEVITGIESALYMMIRNLVDNALRYSPQGGRVCIHITKQNDTLAFHIEDSGPGIPKQEQVRVFRRFYRLQNQNINGSGLGLSIVQRCADLHHAKIHFSSSAQGGLALEVQFPITQYSVVEQLA